MMRNRSWLAGLASKIFPRRFAAARRASRRRPTHSLRSFSDAPLATETLEPRHLLSGVSLVSVDVLAQGNEADGSPTVFQFTRTGDTTESLDANVIFQGTAQPNVDYTAPAGLGTNNTLTVTFDAGIDTANVSLATLADAAIDPYETILAIVQPGSGYAQSVADYRALAHIAAEGVEVALEGTTIDVDAYGNGSSEHLNQRAFAALTDDGSIRAWGVDSYGGTFTPQASGYTSIASTSRAFAARNTDGTITCWGDSSYGGIGAPTETGFTEIFGNTSAFAALKSDGSIHTWGSSTYGGTGGPSGSGYETIVATDTAFAALKSGGSITAWGNSATGGTGAPTDAGYVEIVSHGSAFAALKGDGSITSWGDSSYGGSGAPPGSGYTQIAATSQAFAALAANGSITSWGSSSRGGTGAPASLGHTEIFSNDYAFAALQDDGEISTWGSSSSGGSGGPSGTGYTEIFSTSQAFAALNSSGVISTWGYDSYGGDDGPSGGGWTDIASNWGAFAALSSGGTITSWGSSSYGGTYSDPPSGSGYVSITSNSSAFAALKNDGTIYSWGSSSAGGTSSGYPGYSLAPGDSGYTQVFANGAAFAALKSDGSITSWGNNGYGGILTPSASGHTQIFSNDYAFAALQDDGEISTWGSSSSGGSGGPSGTGYTEIFSTSQAFAALNSSGVISTWGYDSYGGDDGPSGGGWTDIASNWGAFAALSSGGTITSWGSSSYGGTYSDPPSGSGYVSITSNSSAFAALKNDGTIYSWGSSSAGGTSSGYPGYSLAPGDSGYTQVFANGAAFAALKSDGSITSWGNNGYGGILTPSASGHTQIFSNDYAFAALQDDGEISTWGSSSSGGSGGPSGTGYTEIFSTSQAFAALNSSGVISTWGYDSYGGDDGPSGGGWTDIASNWGAFAALSSGGTITSWGSSSYGGTYSDPPSGSGYVSITSNSSAFAALKNDGTIYSWGSSSAGGTSSGYPGYSLAPGDSGYTQVFANGAAFAALKSDGSITSWGNSGYGGTGGQTGLNNTTISSTSRAFAALKDDGTLTSWGDSGYGGSGAPTDTYYTDIFANESAFAALKYSGAISAWGDSAAGGTGAPSGTGFEKIVSTDSAFAALKSDGSIHTWGLGTYGGTGGPSGTGYTDIFSNGSAFAALAADGSITTWGYGEYGGSAAPDGTGYTQVVGTDRAFAALTSDGSLRAWGVDSYGGTPTPDDGFGHVYATSRAFAALNAQGEIFTWGDAAYGGTGAPSGGGFTQLFSTSAAFAALASDGSVTTWGSGSQGGTGGPTGTGFVTIISNGSAFAALHADGSIVSWGDSSVGGSGAPTDTGYVHLFANGSAFTALKQDGTLTSWGNSQYGGSGEPTEGGFVAMVSPATDDVLATVPVFADQTFAMAENSAVDTLIGTLVATDPQGAVVTLTLTGNADPDGDGNAAVRLTGDQLFIADEDDFNFENQFALSLTAVASDGDASSTATITVDISDVNEVATITSPAEATVGENTVYVATVSASDPDPGDTIDYAISGGVDANLFAIDPVSGALSFLSAPDFETPASNSGSNVYEVEVSATDSGGLAAVQLMTVTVTDANESPAIVDPADQSHAEGDVVSLQLSASDPDGDTLSWSALSLPDGLAIDPGTGFITGTLSYFSAGDSSVQVIVDDGELQDVATFNWSVSNTNRAPVLSNPGDQTSAEGDSVSLQLSATDTDGDPLTWYAEVLPPGLSIDPVNGLIAGNPTFDAAGSYAATITVSDVDLSTSTTFNWTIENTNRAPVANDNSYDTLAGGTLSGTASGVLDGDIDLDNQPLTAQLVSDVSHGSLTLNADGSFEYTPLTRFFGTDSFTYQAFDGTTASNTATVTLNVSSLRSTLTDPSTSVIDRFGEAVATDGNYVVVGDTGHSAAGVTPGYGQDYGGQVYLFDTSDNLLQTISNPHATGDEKFGYAVAIEGDHILVGAPGYDLNQDYRDMGRAYLFDTSGNLLQTFESPSQQYPIGSDVDISGNYALIGREGRDEKFLFDISTGDLLHEFSVGNWHATCAIAIDGDTVVIGDPTTSGSGVHLFDAVSGDLLRVLDNPSPDLYRFGYSVAIDENFILVGTKPTDSNNYSNPAYLFDATTGNLLQTFESPIDGQGQNFGYSLVVEGNVALISQPETISGYPSGAVYLFDINTGDLLQTFEDPTPTGNNVLEGFGHSIAINGHQVIVGEGADTSGGSESNLGQVHLFTIGFFTPNIDDQAFSLPENTNPGISAGSLVATDLDDDPLSYAITSGADPDGDGNQAFRIVGDQLIVNDSGDLDHEANAQLILTVEVNDGRLTDSAQIAVNVSNVLEVPIALDDTYQLPPESFMTIAAPGVLGNDNSFESDAPTVVLVSDVAYGTLLLAADGSFFYEPTAGFTGTDSFTYQADDGFNLSNVATVTLEVGPADAPVIDPLSLSVVENSADGALVGTFSSTNPNGGTLTYAIRQGADPDGDGNRAFRIEGDQLLVNDAGDLDYENNPLLSLVVTVTDGTYGTAAATDVMVSDINETPEMSDQAFAVVENSAEATVIGTLVATDVDGDSLTYSISANADPDGDGNDAVRIEGDQLLVNDPGDFNFEATAFFEFTAEVSDGLLTDTAQIRVDLVDVNEVPVANDDSYAIPVGSALTVSAAGILADDVDPDGDALAALLVSDVSNGVLSLSGDGGFSYTANADYYGSDSFTYQASDGENLSNVATVSINVQQLAYISIAATQQGSEADGSATIFTLTRTGNTTDPLDVNLILQGTALPNVDYTAPAGLGVNNTLIVSFAASSDTATVNLPTLSDSVIDPYDSIWAILQPGSGYTIAPVVDRAVAIITAENVVAVPHEGYGQEGLKTVVSDREYLSANGFAALRADGSIVYWGDNTGYYGSAPSRAGYTQIYSNPVAYAALHTDGTIDAWGYADRGGSGGPSDGGYTAVSSSSGAFAALKEDGSISAWGSDDYGGVGAPTTAGFTAIFSSTNSFAAIDQHGAIAVWGNSGDGGSGGPSGDGFIQVASTPYAFAALRGDGTIQAWGNTQRGGAGAPTDSGYIKIFSNEYAFAAIKSDGSIITWGDADYGGSGGPQDAGYVQVSAASKSFAGLKADGRIVTWGRVGDDWGGPIISPPTGNGFTQVFASEHGYAALKPDGSLTSWGYYTPTGFLAPTDTGYTNALGGNSFAAIKADGSLACWGHDSAIQHTSFPSDAGYSQIFANAAAFTVLSGDGSLYSWGGHNNGGSYENGNTMAPAGNGFVAINNPFTDDRLTPVPNQPPAITAPGDQSSSETDVISLQLSASDLDGDPLTWSASGLPTDLSIDAGTGLITGTLSYEAAGNYSVQVSVTDGDLSDTTSFSWAVSNTEQPVNDVSIALTASGSEADGSPTVFTLTRAGDTSGPLDVNLILQGTAQPNVDYTAPAGIGTNNTLTVSFAAGSDTATVSLPTLADSVVDSYENVLAILQSGSGYNIIPGSDRADAYLTAEGVVVEKNRDAPFDGPNSSRRIVDNGNFAVLDASGSIAAWGDADSSLTQSVPVVLGYAQIFSNELAFCALHADGSVSAWGNSAYGGSLGDAASALAEGVVQIVPTRTTFTAFKSDGSVVTWGNFYGGYGTTLPPTEIVGIKKVATTFDAVAVVTEDGDIYAWGSNVDGGGYGGGSEESPYWASPQDTGYTDITGSWATFAALRADGSIRTWGGGPMGWNTPDNSSTHNTPTDDGYTHIVANGAIATSFAAMKADGSITSWGLINHAPPGDSYTQIIPGENTFTAIRTDGSLYSWGVDGALTDTPTESGISQVVANTNAFAAIRPDGSVVTWGEAASGGDSSLVAVQLVDVVKITATDLAFAALKADGSVVTWGDATHGGDSSSVASTLTDVTEIFAINNAFTARRADGSLVSWGADGSLQSAPSETGFVAHVNWRVNDRLTFDSFLSVSPTQISEADGFGAATGTVTRSGDLAGDLVVTLASSDTSEAVVPDTVTIADGQASATFPIIAVDDDDNDLIQPAYITASVEGQYYGRVLLEVADDGDGALFIDDGDPGYSSNVSPAVVTTKGYDGDYRWILGTTPDSPYYIQYEATGIASGEYEIATTWQTQSEISSFQRHPAVKYEIYDGPTLVDTVTVNQQQAPAADYTAGGENFEIIAPSVSIASDTLAVRILIQSVSTGVSGYRTLSADAVRIAIAGGQSNTVPVMEDQTFSVPENSVAGTVVGTLTATDADGDPLTYSIASNVDPDVDGNNAFRIEGGQLLVNDADDFDFETNPQFVITAQASDGSLTDTAQITVNITDVNDAPVFDDQAFAASTYNALDDLVGILSGSDPDGQSLTYALNSNNDSDGDGTAAFRLEGDQLLVNDVDDLANADSPITLTVQASDGSLITPATLRVSVYDSPLVIEDLVFEVSDQATQGDVAGTLRTVFPDPTISNDVNYFIGGDGQALFSVDGNQLIVAADLSALSHSTIAFYYGGFGYGFEVQKNITIHVYDGLANGGEPPVVTEHAAVILESAENTDVAYQFDTASGDVSYSLTSSLDPDGDGTPTFAIEQNKIVVLDRDELKMAVGHAFPELVDWTFTLNYNANLSIEGPIGTAGWWTVTENAADRYAATIGDRDLLFRRLSDGNVILEVGEPGIQIAKLRTIRDGDGEVIYSQVPTASEKWLGFDPQSLTPHVLKVADSAGNYHQVTVEVNRPPVFEDHVFAVDASAAEDTVVGSLSASDADGDAVTFSVADADYDGDGTAAFRVEGDQLVVNDAGDLEAWGAGGQDSDADGVPDRVDNAPDTYNPDQDDFDGDGIGDVADVGIVSSWGYNLGGEEYVASAGLDNIIFQAGLSVSPDMGTQTNTTVASGTGDDVLFNELRFTDGDPLNLQIPVPTVGAEYQVTFYVAHPISYDKGKQDIALEGFTAISAWDTGPRIEAADYGTDDPRPLVRTANVVVNDGVLDVQVTPTADWYPQFDYVMLSAIRIDELQSAAQVTGIQLAATASDGKHTDSAQISVRVNPTGSAPIFADQSFTVVENSSDGTLIGTLVATDADGDALTYSIASNVDPDGDGNAAFRVEGDQLLVNDADDLDYEANPQLVITAQASDGSFANSATITINLTDVPDTPGSISGTFWHDLDQDGTQNGSEPALAGWTAYIDANLNGTFDAGEVTTTSDTNGDYSFGGLDPGTYVIGQVLQSNWTQIYPAGVAPQSMTLATAPIEVSDQDVASVSYEVGIDDLHENTESEMVSCYWPPTDDFSTSDVAQNLQPASYPLDETFLLHSHPGASKVIYLDFDGHVTTGTTWNDYFNEPTITTPSYSSEGDSSFSDAELQEIQNIWARVAEDFIPFDVNVTTEDPGVEALRDTGSGDVEWGVRVVIGEDTFHPESPGGVAYRGSFSDAIDNPSFAFNIGEVGASEVISHEVGHTLGLGHDGTSELEYYPGNETWAPIMGVGYYSSLVQWSKGEYTDANNTEDDLAIITSNNGFGYRVDDHGNALNDATSLASSGNTLVVTSGIIEQVTDQDFFTFATTAGVIDIGIDPFYRSPNLDILATLYDSSGIVVATSNPIGQLGAAFNQSLASGFYSISIEGIGEGDVLGEGYSDYGSLGYYEISGTIINPAISGSHTVTLDWAEDRTGVNFGNKADEDSPSFDDQSFSVPENSPGGTLVGTLTADFTSFEAIIDNSDAGFTSTSEFVYLNNPNKTAEAYNGDNHFARNETTGQATWTFSNVLSGEYRVATTWSHQYENKYNAIDAPFTILDGATQVGAATINQQITPDDFTVDGYGWETLDEVIITSGSLVVNLGVGSANPNNSTVADAVRIERIDTATDLVYAVYVGVDPDGDGNDAFRIEGDQLFVNDTDDLDYEAQPQLSFTAQVSDGSQTDTAQITVNLTDVDDIPIITLLGDSPYVIEASSTVSYSDPGATANDAQDGDLSGSISVSGDVVDLSTPGNYVILYDVQDSDGNQAVTVVRTVTVQDTLAPVITLTGSETTLIEAGFPYTDAGATASDSLDGDVSGSIVVSGDVVDVATTGSYTVLYNVQDAAGNAADQVTRTVTVQDTLRPVISMTYSGEVLQVSDHAGTGLGGEANSPAGLPSETELNAVGSAGRLQTPIVRTTDYTQPDGSPVESRQEWLARSPAGEVSSVPVGAAWDHGDSSIVPGSTIVIIDRDGTPLDETVGAVDFDTRSTYLFEYDAVDDSGNYAEQVVFALILDDQAAPTITVVGGNSETVEAASGWTLSEAIATDNIDGDLTASILYSVENVSTSTTLGTDLTYAEAAALFNTTQVGNYLITIQVSDAAGIYGLNNSNNLATATKAVAIQDTLKPVITLTGDSMINLPQTIGGTYSDPGATAVDSLDGDLSGSVVVGGDVVDLEQDGAYVITYNVQDNAGNVAEQVTRTVNVIPIVVEDVVILDDGEAGFAEDGFTQQSNAQVAAAYDSDVHHMQGGTGEASWTFTGLPADRYQVAATWAYKYNNNYNATDAPFTLSDGAGGVFSTQIVNQKLTPGEFEDAGVMWDTLDTVEVSGGTLVVTLGAGSASNKYVVADAIRVSVAATLTLSINDASVAESAGTAATTATVTRNGPTDYPVDVDLLVSDATEISVPATVTIPAGQASVAFSIDAVDDVFFDGTQSVNVLATAIGYSDGSDSLEILDDETSHTALIDDGEAGFAQSGFTYQNNAQVAAAYNGDNYNLRNGDDADQASWTFTGLDDGAYHVMATWAHKYNNNYNATDAPFQILDAGSNVLSSVAINQKNAPSQHEAGGYQWDTLDTVYVAGGELTVTVGATAQANKFVVADAVRIEQLVQPSSTLVVQLGEEIVDEDAGTVSGIVSRGAETVGDLVVTLNSDDAAVGTVPATVTIPDGAGAVPFTLSVVDDAIVDGDQQVAVTATAAGYVDGTDSLLVEDDEFPPVQIIDNGDAGFTVTGAFKSRTWAEAYDGDNHYMRGSDGEARWHFTDLIDGEYTVSVTWDHISDNKYNATDAPFTIRNAADEQLLAAAVDQTLSPADFSDGVTDWHTLGTVYVIDGELTVSLTEALVNKYVVADAVRLEIDTNPTSKLLVILDASSVSEAGTLNGKVIRTGDTAGSLTVNLASDNAAAATVPATITLGEGARYGTFAITPTDDSAPDGTQVAGISATATGFTAGTAALDVTDDDATILFVDNGEDGFVADAGFKRRNVAGAYQNDNHSMRGGTGEASWTFTGLEEGQYFVSATWNHIYENRYNTEKAPFSITNGSGNLLATTIVDQTQTPTDFTDGGYGWEALAPVYINDGTLIVTLGASSTNHHAVADAIRIELNESLAPSLFVLVDTLSESAGASTGTVVRTGDVSSEATVGLTSSNPDAATVESSITFAIGESTKSFAVTPTDDSSPDGIQQSTIEATAASYAAGSAVLNVQDDDALEVAIMDNTDNGYTSNGFRYNANKQVSDAYGGNNESLKGGEPGEEASWTFTGLADGVYHVSATWNHQYNNNYNAHDAQYSITNAGDEALATTTINQSNAPSEFLDNGIAWGTLETVTVTGGELIVTVSGGSNPNRHTVADAVRIARVAQLGGSSMRMADADPFGGSLMDPLEDALDDLASDWAGASEEEDQLVWGE